MAHNRKESFFTSTTISMFWTNSLISDDFPLLDEDDEIGPQIDVEFGFCPIGAHLWLEKDWQRT